MNGRFVCVLVVCLFFLIGKARAEYAVGYSEDGYVYAGENLWAKGNTYFTREYKEYPGYQQYYTGYGYGYGYKPVTYWYYKYTAQLSPQSSDADWIAWGRERERKAAAVAAQAAAHDNFMAKLTKFGITPPPPGIAGSSSSASSYGAYGVPVTGNTAFGYVAQPYQVQQVADIYVPLNLDALVQTQSIFGNNLLAASREVGNGLTGLGAQQLATNERIALSRHAADTRIALAREDRLRQVGILEATRPPNRVTTTINGNTVTGPFTPPFAPTAPANTPQAPAGNEPARLLKSETATNKCAKCHSGPSSKGGLDITRPLTAAQHLQIVNRATLPLTDQKHMPPEEQLSAVQIGDLLPKADEAAPNKDIPPPKPIQPKPEVKPVPKVKPEEEQP